jgi:hypothetical protein
MVGLACQACLAVGKGHECIHKLAELPPWKTSKRLEMLNQILEGDSATNLRENYGIVITNRKFLFQTPWILALSQRMPFTITVKPHIVWIFIDPSGGGTQSEMAICSMVYQDRRDIVSLFVNVLLC